MKKLIAVFILAVAAAGVFIFFAREQVVKDEEAIGKPVVKIGAILSLTGNLSTWGIAHHNGMILAHENLPENTQFRYELISEDCGDGIKTLPMLISKLLNLDKVEAVTTIFDPNANVVAPIMAKAKKIHIGESWFPTFLGDKYNFNSYASIRQESEMIAGQIKKEGYKNLVLFTAVHSGFINGTNLLKEEFKKQNISVCKEIEFHFGQRDFRTPIAQAMRECNPDFYVIGAFPPESDILIKQINEISGKRMPMTGLDLGVNGSLYGLYEGYWFPAPARPNEEFVKKYLAKFKTDDYWYGAGIGYTVFSVLVDAYEHARADNKIPTADEVSSYIRNKKNFDSVFGTVTVGDSGQINIPAEMLIIRNGQPVLLGK